MPKRTPCLPRIKRVRVREGLVSSSCQRRLGASVPHYLVTLNLPDVAVRFRTAVRQTVQFVQQHPSVGPRCRSGNSRLQALRTWPVAGFEAIRIYYLRDDDTLHVIRILHGKRDVNRILEREGGI